MVTSEETRQALEYLAQTKSTPTLEKVSLRSFDWSEDLTLQVLADLIDATDNLWFLYVFDKGPNKEADIFKPIDV